MVASENEFCKNPTSKNTITTIDSESYGSIGEHKHSLDQDSGQGINADHRGVLVRDAEDRVSDSNE